jgi:hypothetical protein
MAASYASLAWLKSVMQITDDSDDSPLQLALDAATSLIDQWTGRSFAGETGATKYFYATSPTILDLVPDIRTVTSVAVDTNGDLTFPTALLATDYLLSPLMPRPDPGIYHQLRIAPNSSRAFPQDRQVRVVGDWGYTVGGEAPAPIRQACLIQAERLFKRAREAPFGILQTTDLGQFTRISTADPDVMALIEPYQGAAQEWIAV